MKCPNCESPTENIEIIYEPGRSFEINHCSSCGGFWLDKDELFQIPPEEAQKIDYPSPSKVIPDNLKCPFDQTLLTEFKESKTPSFISLYSCPSCKGFFVPKGHLFAYKETQKEKNLRSIGLSRKTVVGFSIAFVIFVLFFALISLSENIIKADPLVYNTLEPTMAVLSNVFFLLSLSAFLFTILVGVIYYLRKRL